MNKRAGWKGAAAGFVSAFTALLLTAPQDGGNTRRRIAGMSRQTFNAPAKLLAAYRGRKQKMHEFGRIRHEQLADERASLKTGAQQSAASDLKKSP
ncbi:hypothetical protein [Salibacterium sp. K-3]